MRKILIFAAALLTLYSCKKEPITTRPDNLQAPPTPTVAANEIVISANGIVNEPTGANLAGFPLLDLCSNEIWITLSGTVVFYIASDGIVKPLGVYNFVFQDKKANIYSAKYSLAIEPFTGFGSLGNIYKLTFNPQSPGNNRKLLALMQVNTKEDGSYIVLIDSGTIACH